MKMKNMSWLTFLFFLSCSHGNEISLDRQKMERGELEGKTSSSNKILDPNLIFFVFRYFAYRGSGTCNGLSRDLHSTSGTFSLIPVSAVPHARGQVASMTTITTKIIIIIIKVASHTDRSPGLWRRIRAAELCQVGQWPVGVHS